MSDFIKRLVMAEFNRIDALPAEQFDSEYPIFHAAIMRLFGGAK
jgi:hypothetical protein